ncbi:ubl carboxyl-terminal hydrolase 18 isoform X1 [Tachysurus fulvidraco]|uniref:ubl carboxyl-terminal hydrolase 18 isoform X1 n=1 Tax=Tachysurus fulvidraco TaxID=1234273 RepID=UPI000F50BE8C|nr:ubl carboxyl-terminal hydrolase 18 isoform X1 [Tachysurus fulvidraco]
MGMSLCKMSHFLGNITASLVTRAGSHRHTRVRGLSNCGLSCSINALLQTFSATTELQELLSRWQPSENADKRNVLLELKRALEAMKDKRQATPHLDLLDCLHEYNICRFTEHDADEVFHTILNLIQKQMSDQQIAADIKNLYKIDVEECTECSECGNVQRAPNIFLSFPLHLHDERNTLMDCFRMFFEPQMLEGSEAFYCGKCERKMPSTQRCKLVSLPSILCINLKRFRNIHGYTRKMYTKVSFPETINMAEILPEEHSQAAERRYRLYAVVVHAGMAMMGHYTAYIYSTDSMWYYINDSHMQQVSWEEVQRTYGGCRSKTAYMLLYRTLSSGAVQEPNP